MNKFVFSGTLTRSAEIREVNGTDVLQFHCTVGAGRARQPLWVMAEVWKGKLIDNVSEQLVRGVTVTCIGTVQGRFDDQLGPLCVRVTEILPHLSPAELGHP